MKQKYIKSLLAVFILAGFSAANAQVKDKFSFGLSGQVHYNETLLNVNRPSLNGELDFHKLSVKGAYKFNDALSFNTTLKVEHAFDKAYDNGDFFFDKMYLDYRTKSNVSIQAGMIKTPFNSTKPKPYSGVETALFDKVITLSWRELGVGINGDINSKLSYKTTITTGLVPSELSKSKSIYAAKNSEFNTSIENIAVGASLKYKVDNGLNVGGSALISTLDSESQFDGAHFQAYEAYITYDYKEFSTRLVGGYSRVKNVEKINSVFGNDVGESQIGGILEVSYNLLSLNAFERVRGDHFSVFGTTELLDTQFTTVGIDNDASTERANHTIGLIYSPVSKLTFKVDYQFCTVAQTKYANLFNVSFGFSL